MKQAECLNFKANFDLRKRGINGKLFQNQKTIKEEFIINAKKAMGKKYMQQSNIFKHKLDQPKKQHRQIVISEQFIKSSKLFCLLRQKIDRCDSMFVKQVNSINEHKMKLKQQIMQLKSQNYQEKVGLWELKNKLMQLRCMFNEEEQQSRRLAQQNYGEYQEEEQFQCQNQQQNDQQSVDQMINQNGNEKDVQQQNKQQKPFENSIGKMHNIERRQQNVGQTKENIGQDDNSQQNEAQFTQILQQVIDLKAQRKKTMSFKQCSQNYKVISNQLPQQSNQQRMPSQDQFKKQNNLQNNKQQTS